MAVSISCLGSPFVPCLSSCSRQWRSGYAEFDQLQQVKFGLFFGAFKLGSDWQRPLSFRVVCFVTSLQKSKRSPILGLTASLAICWLFIWTPQRESGPKQRFCVLIWGDGWASEQNRVIDPFELPAGVRSCCSRDGLQVSNRWAPVIHLKENTFLIHTFSPFRSSVWGRSHSLTCLEATVSILTVSQH